MNLPKGKTILFFSPHCDDEIIAAGALLTTLAKKNNVIVYYFTNSPRGVVGNFSELEKIEIRQKEANETCKILGVKAQFLNLDKQLKQKKLKSIITLIKKIILKTRPSLVITLYEYDTHPTHQKATKLVRRSLNGTNIPLWFGEVWTPILKPNDAYYFDENLMNIKLKAWSQYFSQDYRTNWKEAVKSLNRYRAISLREQFDGFGSATLPKGKYAEAFLINR
ncbi:hypothetical protein COS31_02840 [Candidatus Roizmanbacteria bacterium CG02_land_8_20_14_3_00_36_15]|uniref:PIG-L family deacetylase n=2 Tax=Candidatus Roizmaniibacteriota TaxID=1752723 RepID=A0A2M8KMB5_9BACT|nr:MAG: hypothetical protein COS51_01310 [Candidatus Roizmanbacteria bacterium CG03_land_8_20_14_0_80_36_21]PIV37785.1 MAG: hypothetical protein COS31_02840 [Candidatus Roizmanbacteria bacterium CG02_land_8_20_14_3_00_36_15]PIY70015.1 MAG: hypothetical protein COY89_03385 [Candidatus Roizmanbacteria bacterium CG_4_10_14_0_8_um_filter_36_36]PJA52883.1 MAG: hypothetical protein CO166_03875 [Candidatus Roizmanbacteria bacterium CG_4_9_14_3_um_filter_36_11]PJC81629.1 MAG: hypothetical protein CO007